MGVGCGFVLECLHRHIVYLVVLLMVMGDVTCTCTLILCVTSSGVYYDAMFIFCGIDSEITTLFWLFRSVM